MLLKFHNSIDGIQPPPGYGFHQWLEKSLNGKSLAKRSMSGAGDDQPVNMTLELTATDSQKVENSSSCKVVIE